MNVLFICTGNTCRSPMCEAYFRHLCTKFGHPELSAGSAGVFTEDGLPASAHAFRTMEAYGIDLSGFRSRQLTEQMIAGADLIVAMSASHRRRIAETAPEAAGKTHLLMEYADAPGRDVADPFAGSLAVYQACFEGMKGALDNLFLDLAGKHSTTTLHKG